MTETEKAPSVNIIGLTRDAYKGSISTLCTGCGHDSITNNIISAFYQSGIDPFDVAKMSGIGCSSKTPAYYLEKSCGLNAIHGRMPSISIGTKVANTRLKLIGMSGDGDTASIGIGGFVHLVRRNLPIAYIIANNGVYGLTKGQFSATASKGSKIKSGAINELEDIDLCALAIQLGCTFVARSFSGDSKQLIPLISAAMRHNGTAVIDIVSPCVTFNNQSDSTKSYDFVKQHKLALQEMGFIEPLAEIKVDYPEGEKQEVTLPDGSRLLLRKLDSRAHDVSDKMEALRVLMETQKNEELLTGLLYCRPGQPGILDSLNLCEKPLALLNETEARPPAAALNEILSTFR